MHIGNIFADLEINTEGMMDDKASIKRFAAEVVEAEKLLSTVLTTNGPTVSSIEDQAINAFRDDPKVKARIQKEWAPLVNSIYTEAEGEDLAVAYGVAQALKKLAADIETAIHDRAKLESTSQQDSINDKKLAQIQHKRLREAWETYAKFVKIFHGIEVPKIKARPGNYAPSLTDVYQYQFPGEEDVMYNHRVVAQRLQIWYDGMKFMDIFEYCMNHPDLVTVKKVRDVMDDEQIFEVAVLIRRRWAEAFNNEKACRHEINDGSPDWALFHLDRVTACRKDLKVWEDILNTFTDEHRSVINKAMGL